ncbi:hypothetical protein BJX66DRAFT_340544 [Aspergillus keveii]|uniref:CFEM domain-containing protein n=1 Tax=Aspergillus keveii TaxID=714993 RepID=A0ABR4FY10_9EURO
MDGLPSCAVTCFIQALSASSCAATDNDCICADNTLNQALEACIFQSCTIKEALTTRRLTQTSCGESIHAPDSQFVILSTVFLVISMLCVLLRLAGRLVASKLGWDDLTIGLASGLAIAIGVLAFPIHNAGLGTDFWNIPFENITRTLYLFAIVVNLYPPTIALIKISMLLLYLRLFPSTTLRIATITILTLTAIWGLVYTLINIFICNPRSYAWEQWDGEHEGRCMDQQAILMSHAIINIVLDVVVIGLPLSTLLRLKLGRDKKVGVFVMFVIGILVTILSILRLTTTMGFLKSKNPTRDFIPVCIWSVLEIDLGILCACMPGIRACFRFIVNAVTGKSEITEDSHDNSESRLNSKSKSFRLSTRRISLSLGRSGDFVTLDDMEGQLH